MLLLFTKYLVYIVPVCSLGSLKKSLVLHESDNYEQIMQIDPVLSSGFLILSLSFPTKPKESSNRLLYFLLITFSEK